MKVSIQGIKGSFHDIVARAIFGEETRLVENETFEQVFEDVRRGMAKYGIIAIENSIAGSILENYDLLERFDLNIAGEYYLRIKHNLLALEGQKLKDIKEVRSHPMALKQCQTFLKQMSVRLVESDDTASSVKEIKEKKLKSVAAIASRLAAQIYGLEILVPSIESDKQNYTRFLVITMLRSMPKSPIVGNSSKRINGTNKSSIVVEIAHKPGSLAKIIDIFAAQGVNLTKIESRPIVGKPWEYRFYIDFELDAYTQKGTQLLDRARQYSTHLKILGSYKTFK